MTDGKPLARCVDRLESEWQGGGWPRIADCLPPELTVDGTARRDILEELICVDLEYRWRREGRRRTSRPWTLEDYARELPELGSLAEIPLRLVAEEFRVRHRFGDRPSIDEFRQRFFGRWTELEPLLVQMLAELQDENHLSNRWKSPAGQRSRA